ncbi:MAG: hypothetical protein KDC54_01925 [Lewinella sp.]|nr:hypothetical protein [Lewinella sp.]
MRLFIIVLGILTLAVFSCQNDQPAEDQIEPAEAIDTARQVVEQAIQRHGGELLPAARIGFTFRGRRYEATGVGGNYTYRRIFANESGEQIVDELTPRGLTRTIDGEAVALTPKDSSAYAGSVNSVLYFALLPYYLQDEAVQLTYLGLSEQLGAPYHKVKVTFRQDGGGEDFQDEYTYWIHRDSLTMDYLAYNYLTNGGGARFRSAYHGREVGGIRFQDYVNFKPRDERRDVWRFDSLFAAGLLDTLSLIALEAVEVDRD